MEQSSHSSLPSPPSPPTPTHEAEVYFDVPKSNDETKAKVVTFAIESTTEPDTFVEGPKTNTDPFFEGSTAGVPGIEMDHTKIDNKSGVGVEMDQNNTHPSLCVSLTSSRLYKHRMDAKNNV